MHIIMIYDQDFGPWLGNVLHAILTLSCLHTCIKSNLTFYASINVSFSLVSKCCWMHGIVIDK